MTRCAVWFLIILSALSPLSAQPLRPGPGALEVHLRLEDIRPYYPHSEIPFVLTLTNRGEGTLLVHLAQVRQRNVRFFSLLQSGPTLPGMRQESDAYLAHQAQRDIFLQPLVLGPAESFSFRGDLKQWLNLSVPGLYEIYALFAPDPRQPEVVNQSNRIALVIRPPEDPDTEAIQTASLRLEVARQEHLRREALPPDEVIRRFLTARREQREAAYFLYVNLEELYRRDPVRNNLFRRSSQETRERLLAEFRHRLWNQDPELVRVPSGWEIEKTEYDSRNATVRALVWYTDVDFTARRRFIFLLSRRDRYWEIVDYYMEVLPDQANVRSRP